MMPVTGCVCLLLLLLAVFAYCYYYFSSFCKNVFLLEPSVMTGLRHLLGKNLNVFCIGDKKRCGSKMIPVIGDICM